MTEMRTAFAATVRQLVDTLHQSPQGWTWGALHTRQFPSLTGAAALGYGPRASGGDLWTVDAAEGGMNSVVGPSWRMVVAWSGTGAPVADGIYPGGQSENPASPWYSDMVADWWAGTYLPMPSPGGSGVAVRLGSRPASPTSVAAKTTGSNGASPAAGARSAAGSSASATPSASFPAAITADAPAGVIVWELLP